MQVRHRSVPQPLPILVEEQDGTQHPYRLGFAKKQDLRQYFREGMAGGEELRAAVHAPQTLEELQ